MSMMVRIMSLLPFATGSLCLLLVLVSFFGFASGTIDDEIPALPCVGPQDECATGMSESDLDVPTAFLLLDVHLDISMELDDAAWIGIVDSKFAITCPPGDTGLTNCTSTDYTYMAGGPSHEGTIVARLLLTLLSSHPPPISQIGFQDTIEVLPIVGHPAFTNT